MKKRALLFPVIVGLGYLVLTSEANGYGGMSPNNDFTGSQGSTCGNCHSGSNTTTTATFSMIDKVTSQPITNGMYTPGKVYTVTLTGVNSGTLSRFGYQAEPLTASMGPAGTLTATQSSQHLATMNGGRILVENTSRLTGTAANLSASFDWTAPVAGTGTVTFYGCVNAVNGTGGTGGDKCSPGTTFVLAENTSSVESINALASIQLYPNPTSDNVNLKLEGLQSGNYSIEIFNLNGQLLSNQNLEIVGSKNIHKIYTSNLSSGLYQLVITSEGWNKVLNFIKN